MPTYGYRCNACNFEFDKRQSMTEKRLVQCPDCGKRSLERVISVPYVITHEPKSTLPNSVDVLLGKPHAGSPRIHKPKAQGGLYGVAMLGNGDIVLNPNLAGPPPGCFMREGRIVLTDTRQSKKPDNRIAKTV